VKKKILHICERSTFIENAITNFNKVFPSQNVFLINTDPSIKYNYKGDFDENNDSVVLARFGSEKYSHAFEETIKNCCLVVFHNLGQKYKRQVVSRLEGKIPMHAILWGWEIFNSVNLSSFNYEPETYKYFRNRKLGLKGMVVEFLQNILPDKQLRLLHKVNSVSTILKSEYEYLESNYRISAKYIPFNYSKIAILFNDQVQNSGSNISIGNSATYANNHLDVLKIIAKTNLEEGCEIILPLSYGDDMAYKYLVEESFKSSFGSAVNVLGSFLPLDKFNTIIKSCGFVILNHVRQQALGNVFLCLINGGKVFLNKDGFVYKELSEMGIKVYKIEEFKNQYPEKESREVAKKNCEIIIQQRSQEKTELYIKELVNSYLDS